MAAAECRHQFVLPVPGESLGASHHYLSTIAAEHPNFERDRRVQQNVRNVSSVDLSFTDNIQDPADWFKMMLQCARSA